MSIRSKLLSLKTYPKRALSQNFLIDKNIIHKLVDLANVSSDDFIIEIGPGLGAITKVLLEKNVNVLAIEKDLCLVNSLSQELQSSNFTCIHDDFLKFDLSNILKKEKKIVKVVANIPFHIATPIIEKLFSYYPNIFSISIVLQKELAQRIAATPGNKQYGSLTLFAQYHSSIQYAFNISKNCFYPKPTIDSAVIHMLCHKQLPLESEKYILFERLIRLSFQQRRKTLRSSLKKIIPPIYINQALISIGKDINIRAENLSIYDFLKLFQYLSFNKIIDFMLNPIKPF